MDPGELRQPGLREFERFPPFCYGFGEERKRHFFHKSDGSPDFEMSFKMTRNKERRHFIMIIDMIAEGPPIVKEEHGKSCEIIVN